MKILSTFLLMFFTLTLMSQSISELESELKTTSSKERIMNIKYDLAELYKNKDRSTAARYAFESYAVARELRDEDMMSLAAYLDAEIHIARRDYDKASARFKASLKHSKNAGDTQFAIENLRQLEKIELKERNYKEAYNYSKEAVDLLSSGGVKASPRPKRTQPTPTAPSRSNSVTSENADYVKIIRKLKVEKADLEEENNSLMSKIERIGNNEMTAKELQDEIKKEREQQEAEREEAILQMTEKDRRLEAAAAAIRNEQRNKNKIEAEFETLSEAAKKDKVLLMDAELQAQKNKTFARGLALAALFILFLATIFYNRFRINRKAKKALQETNRQIEEERKLSDELLLNILPSPIAKELKESGKASAEKFDNVTVLFTDFKNFTKISERLTPEQLVRELDYCFRGFDFILSQYGVEKIKTIGDAYMCASGLTKTKTLPINIVKAALEMQEFLEDYKKERMVKGLPHFEARMGIHTGPVVAGVVGVKKFAYDIWGDTVNIAARMEANSEVGKVNISETTYRQIKYNFDCEHRGKIDAKNKGFIDMYYVKQPVGQLVNS